MSSSASPDYLKVIGTRNWAELQGRWQAHIPEIIPKGSRPGSSLAGTDGFGDCIEKIKKKGEISRLLFPEIRTSIFRESIFLIHKGVHVLEASQIHVESRFFTWSLSEAYHSAFFFAKAMSGLLGIAIAQTSHGSLLIDCFPPPKPGEKWGAKYQTGKDEVVAINIGGNPDHRSWWSLFSYLIQKSDIGILEHDSIKKIASLDAEKITYQRNNIHYKNHEWILDDMFMESKIEDFGTRPDGVLLATDIDTQAPDFSIIFAFFLLGLLLTLLKDAAGDSRAGPEFSFIQSLLARKHHAMLRAAVPSACP